MRLIIDVLVYEETGDFYVEIKKVIPLGLKVVHIEGNINGKDILYKIFFKYIKIDEVDDGSYHIFMK